MSGRDFSSYLGPGDKDLPRSEIEGYQPVSRIGEVVMNAFVDSYEFAALEDGLKAKDMVGENNIPGDYPGGIETIVEHKPYFHEWASAQPGMICLARKKKTAVFRNYVAAETAVPVIACAACLPKKMEHMYFFAGICRSKTVRSPDDGLGPSVDEFFTVAIGGMSTLLNTSAGPLHPGDLVEWTFVPPKLYTNTSGASVGPQKRQKQGPRRISVKIASVSSPRVIGRVLSFAKPGETFDLLIRQ